MPNEVNEFLDFDFGKFLRYKLFFVLTNIASTYIQDRGTF